VKNCENYKKHKMSKENCSEIDKIEKIRSIENDCDPSLLILMATEEPSFDVSKNENIDLVQLVAVTTPETSATIKPREGNSKTQEKNPKEKVDRNNSVDSNGSNKNRRKTRRGKSKRKSSKPYTTKSKWSYHIPRIQNMKRKVILTDVGQPLVPYNTNKFLMEDHMPHIANSGAVAVPLNGVGTPSRTRDSSFSIDSEENYFYSLPEDEEEFLTKEFSNVYEDARCERLEAMTKAQLIQEFLQMEATVEQLTRRVNAKRTDDKSSDDRTNRTVQFLEQRIKDMAAENTGKYSSSC
jgi:protein HEXIM1/2